MIENIDEYFRFGKDSSHPIFFCLVYFDIIKNKKTTPYKIDGVVIKLDMENKEIVNVRGVKRILLRSILGKGKKIRELDLCNLKINKVAIRKFLGNGTKSS